ncbi:MAG TPA: YbaB/EbfC family nucleoid-associated protein [Pirellulales bacterium]|nr:YbaB/EbfC family nucleoid-associated protein [Pirellulales bacterium]
MFKGLGNLAGMLKQAQQMGSRLAELNETLRGQKAEGAAGGGMVTVEVNGLGEVLSCRIDPSVAGDRELVEDLVPAAVNAALNRAKQLHADAVRGMTAGMDLPGLDEMMAQVTGGKQPPNE